ncbi:MAG: hypothetical protein ISS83_02750 [Candidatus Pacebacteria bacterium]|nr:hypothetical protein [Candidatus Paceibacterota bacterium]
MLAESDRKKLIQILADRRDVLEEEVIRLKKKSENTLAAKDTYEKIGNGTEVAQDLAVIDACGKTFVKAFKQVILRLEDVREFRFNAVCPGCNGDIAISDLLVSPLMVLCASCQQAKNQKKQ